MEIVHFLPLSHFSLLGVLGIKVKIMLPWDSSGKSGPKRPLPDAVSVVEPKDEETPAQPYSEQKGVKPMEPVAPGQPPQVAVPGAMGAGVVPPQQPPAPQMA